MAQQLLQIKEASVRYKLPSGGSFEAVKGVNLAVEPASVVGLVGESGCGKSTLAKAVCGLVPVSGGEILFKGNPVAPLCMRRRPRELMRIQMVFQNPYASLNPRRTIGSQIADGLRANPVKDSWSVADLLQQVELPTEAQSRYPHQFSGGQRQRIAIARAIAAGPELLIGDEPIASLDASLQAKVATLMRKLALESGAALLFISHDLAVVRIIADQIAVMQRGSLVEQGSAAQVWEDPQREYTKRLLAAIPAVDGMGRLPGVNTVTEGKI